MPRVSVSLPDDVYDAVLSEAEEKRLKVSDVVRDAVTQVLYGERWMSIGSVAEQAIRDGLTNQEARERVLAKFPHAKTSPESIAWYRVKLRKAGDDVPTDIEARRDRQARLAGVKEAPRAERRPAGSEKVGAVAMKFLAQGLSNDETLAAVRAQLPHAQTSLESIASYRSRMRANDPSIPTDAQAKRARSK
jgi:hypothetical protein